MRNFTDYKENTMDKQQVLDIVMELGAAKAGLINVEDIPFNAEFRKACEANSCGNYGKSWMCPPDVGEIEQLINNAKKYSWAVVYQTIGTLEDSYDFEGMMEAGKKHNQLAGEINSRLGGIPVLHLGAGGCRVCDICAKKENRPCPHPDKAMASLEAYGVSVSELAQKCNMKYINGQDTVTYFGALLF